MKRSIGFYFLIALSFAVAISSVCYTFHLYNQSGDKAANFGNAFGFANVVVSGIALLFVVITLQQTQNELRDGQKQFEEQQKQLMRNTDALEAQKDELARQATLMTQQAVDTRFFQLLQLLQGIVETVEVWSGEDRIRARAAFHVMYSRFMNTTEHPQIQDIPDKIPTEQRREQVSRKYRSFYGSYSNEIGHFFRTLYHIVLWVDQIDATLDQKRFFIRLVRAQLSQSQLLLLFYSSVTDGIGYEKFYPLIEKYDLLQNLGRDQLLSPGDVRFYQSLSKHPIE